MDLEAITRGDCFSQACIEAIDYLARRELDKAVIRQLAICRWIDEHHAVILVGATGTGKSFIACALAHQACRKGYRALYRRASRLFHELTLACTDGTYVRLLGKLARMDVLVIDDWGLVPVQDQERRDLLEILEDRYGTRSTIITSQLPPARGPKTSTTSSTSGTSAPPFCSPVTGIARKGRTSSLPASAALDRLTHGAHFVEITAQSCRAKHTKKQLAARRSRSAN